MKTLKILKKTICLTIIATLLSQNIIAQSKLCRTNVPYKIKLYHKENGINNKGILYSVTDSSIILISELDYYRLRSNIDMEKKIVIPANQITKIILWKKNRFGKVLVVSTIIGGTIGAIAGYTSEEGSAGLITFTSKEKALVGGIGGAFIGAIAGCFIGSIKVSIPINRNTDKFKKKKDFLAKRCL